MPNLKVVCILLLVLFVIATIEVISLRKEIVKLTELSQNPVRCRFCGKLVRGNCD